MPINFEAALGIHDQALAIHSRRAEILANNIVNADTPGFKARDVNFGEILSSQMKQRVRLSATNSRHISTSANTLAGESLQYRVPLQPSLDGNTVDLQMEQAEYAKNALRFQSSLTFLNGKFQGLRKAIKGE
ncbi:MAG: flagellar basal body rod protein FlgB [Pseudomonadales bacterium]|nr:flagellar basal body rod protein FlgB [Pseudomonadales bacterium]